MTGFTSVPLRLATFAGLAVAGLSVGFGVFLFIRRLIRGPEAEGLFTLFAILFFLVGALFFALGLLGEYVGRIYDEVRHRPRSVVAETINFGAWTRRGRRLRVLFFGYSQIGHRAVHLLAERRDDVLAVVTHRDDPHENRWYQTPAEAAAAARVPRDLRRGARAGRSRGSRREPGARPHPLASSTAICCPTACWARRAWRALNLHPSLLPAYRGRAPSTGCWSTASARPASRSTTWWRRPTPATSWRSAKILIGRGRPPSASI